MRQTWMSFLVAAVYMLGSASVSHAAVYDLESLATASTAYNASPGSFAQLAVKGGVLGKWFFDEPAETNALTCFNGGASMGPIGRGMSYVLGADRMGGGVNGRLSTSISYIGLHGIDGGHAQRHLPATAAHEPDVYAMLAAAFGLLFLSARRRKSDTFD